MSALDTMTPLLLTPWVDASGKTLSVRALPGLRPELIKTLNSIHPLMINPVFKALLAKCCGLADTELGQIDFTGCCFPEEPCCVFQPCLTVALDDAGRRWIAEVGNKDLPGPVWCVFPDPHVAVHVSDDLTTFLAASDAYVYDLRRPSTVRGWPYGVAGPSARQYRCGRLPVFAVAGSPTEGWRAGQPATTSPVHPLAAQSLEIELPSIQ